jgi:hypothetical protein
VSDNGESSPPELTAASDELLKRCRAGRVRAVAHRSLWPDPSLKYSIDLQDQQRWAFAVINKGHPSDVAETIPPHEWLGLEWEPFDEDECSLRSTYSKRRVWTHVRFLRDDLIREWPSRNAPRRGRPKKIEETKKAMRLAIDKNEISRGQLAAMKGKELEHRFQVGRTTATAARRDVLDDVEPVGNSIPDK